MRILLVEDDPLLGDGVQKSLSHLGFTVDWLRDGRQAEHALASEDYAAVVLDLGLPQLDGLAVLRSARESGLRAPVLILTARDKKSDKLSGFGLGADDYVIKPVDMEELAARLHALIRRSGGHATARLCIGPVEIDPAAHRAWRDGESVDLSAREFAILEQLMQNAGRVLTRAQLEESLYGWGDSADSNTVEVFIHHLRKKLGADFIRTLRGIGYSVERQP
ncbi:MAG: DNA-binding response regulator [Hydrogenophilales bacterium CG_4_9_14_3_um_filter_59_35]|nr:MAG: DNA-binding response regulator [Hydrogenophilales bacterium CG18_big_fil_WC_8_21_14_2_50_58_12]PJB06473.1 MAG: DNA-binding response regulator [Hydrogenophilales bacterium CG_4_9_14_3_um_filter_59_35]